MKFKQVIISALFILGVYALLIFLFGATAIPEEPGIFTTVHEFFNKQYTFLIETNVSTQNFYAIVIAVILMTIVATTMIFKLKK